MAIRSTQVLPAILFVKANNAEQCESARFQKLAHSDLSACLEKKKMKALIPQIVQFIYFGSLFIFCAGSLLISSGSFDASRMVSFITSLVFLIEPIQVGLLTMLGFLVPFVNIHCSLTLYSQIVDLLLYFQYKSRGQEFYNFEFTMTQAYVFPTMMYDSAFGNLFKVRISYKIMQGIGKAYNELKQGEPAIERLFDLVKFKSKVIEIFSKSAVFLYLSYVNGKACEHKDGYEFERRKIK